MAADTAVDMVVDNMAGIVDTVAATVGNVVDIVEAVDTADIVVAGTVADTDVVDRVMEFASLSFQPKLMMILIIVK